jgi:C-terminal processing protease CtpA/Prc
VEKVKNAKDSKELKSILERLFMPIAPAARILTKSEKLKVPLALRPNEISGLKVIAWQHQGVGFGSVNSIYRSIRLNRENILTSGMGAGVLTQGIEARSLRGKDIRLIAAVRTRMKGAGQQAQLWMRVDREGGAMGFFDNMNDRPIRAEEWRQYEITGKVDSDATAVFFGAILGGSGRAWFDDFQVLVKENNQKWQQVEINNPGFEDGEAGKKPQSWGAQSPGYIYKTQTENTYSGGKCLHMESRSTTYSGKLFDAYPQVGEVIHRELDAGLLCFVPLALYSDETRTLGENQNYPHNKVITEMEAHNYGTQSADNEFVRLAGVVIAWNVFQHFYPYFDVVNVDWDGELTKALRDALTDTSEEDFFYTLSRLVAKLQDGHGNVYHRVFMEQAGLPIRVDWVEDQVVVTGSEDPNHFQRGDVVLSIDGTDSVRTLMDTEEFISGSPQWKRYKSLMRFGYGKKGTMAKLEVQRGAETFDIEHERNFMKILTEPTKPSIQALENNVYYVNLDLAPWNEIVVLIDDLANAQAVIFDLRGYPKENHEIICHLLEDRDTSNAWMQIPQIIYPDQENIVGYQKMGWNLVKKEPHIKGKVVFITDGRAISYAESFLSFVEHYKLGEIVGQPTAGTNGNVNPFVLPGDYRITWTGMRVLKHDGSQHHLIGIQPTVPAIRTVQGVREGRDEFFEKALEVIGEIK